MLNSRIISKKDHSVIIMQRILQVKYKISALPCLVPGDFSFTVDDDIGTYITHQNLDVT